MFRIDEGQAGIVTTYPHSDYTFKKADTINVNNKFAFNVNIMKMRQWNPTDRTRTPFGKQLSTLILYTQPWKWGHYNSLKRRSTPTRLHCITSQKTIVWKYFRTSKRVFRVHIWANVDSTVRTTNSIHEIRGYQKFETLEFDSSPFQTIGCNCKLIPSKDVSYLA